MIGEIFMSFELILVTCLLKLDKTKTETKTEDVETLLGFAHSNHIPGKLLNKFLVT